MELVNPNFLILQQTEAPWRKVSDSESSYRVRILDHIHKHIEVCGRTCYKSEDKITDDSAGPFVERMVSSNHLSMLEHGTVYLAIPITTHYSDFHIEDYRKNPHSRVTESEGFIFRDHLDNKVDCWCITTNLRVIEENGWRQDLEFLCVPSKFHARRHTVRFTTNIQFYKDMTRQRPFSWAIESTRWCMYMRKKFKGCLTYIRPLWLDESKWYQKVVYLGTLKIIEWAYKFLTWTGWQAQQASNLLPQATKATVCMTGFEDEFRHAFDLRADGTTGKPHPQVQELMVPLKQAFIEYGWYKEA